MTGEGTMNTLTLITGEETVADANSPEQALIDFYAAFNHANMAGMERNWANDPSAVMANPLGGIMTGWQQIRSVYERLFARPKQVYVEYYDFTINCGVDQFVAVGRERGFFTDSQNSQMPLEIRTSRFFQKQDGQWRQIHHHGSIDNPELLSRYQREIQQQFSSGAKK